MKFGVPWVGGAGKDGLARTASQSPADDLNALYKRLDKLTQQLERSTRGAGAENSPAFDEASETAAGQEVRTVGNSRFDERLDRIASEPHKTSKPAARTAESVAGQRRETPARASSGDISAALNQAIAEISLRQQMLESEAEAAAAEPRRKESAVGGGYSNAAQFSGLEEQLRQLTTQMESLSRPSDLDNAVAALRQDLAEIGHTLTEAMPRRAIEALEAEVRALSERIYDSRHSGVDASQLAGVEQGLAEIRDALRGLTPSENLVGFEEAIRGLANKVDQIASSGQDPAALEQVQTAIPQLRGIMARVASDEALKKLTDEVRELSARVERVADDNANSGLDALTTMEQQLAKLTDVVAAQAQARPVLPPQLETVISALSDKLEQMHLSRGDQVAVGHLEDRIAKLVEKLDSSDSRLDHLAAIERGLADLLVRLDELRSAGAIRPLDGSDGQGGVAVASLERDIAEIKEVQSLSARRTQETFEVVKGTLGEVVERLATIENDLHTAPGAPAVESKPKSAFRALLGSVTNPSPPARPIDPSLPPDHPLEPGIGPLRERAGADQVFGADSASRDAAAEGDKPSLISAARRALLANASDSASANGSSRERSRGLVAGFRNKGVSQKIRSVLVAASVVVIVLATAHMAMNMFWPERADLPGLNKQNQENRTAPNSRGEGAGSAPAPATTNSIPDRRSALPAADDAKGSPIPPSGVMIPESSGRVAGPVFNPSTVLGPQADVGVTGSIPSKTPAGAPATGNSATSTVSADKVPAAITSPTLRVAAANGDPSAEYEVGIRFAEGRGVTQNLEEAARWLERAARAGIVPAQFRLGSLYEKGLGVKKDIEAARKLYMTAAEKGHAKAMHNLAVLYAEGVEGKPDYKTASHWFARAANHGIADSQYNLGILYARGIGVEQNLPESYKWFTLAAGQGDQDAAKKRDDVATKLDAQALMAARLAAQTWTASPQPDEATSVKTPAGGWDKPVSALQPSKPKPRISPPKTELL